MMLGVLPFDLAAHLVDSAGISVASEADIAAIIPLGLEIAAIHRTPTSNTKAASLP